MVPLVRLRAKYLFVLICLFFLLTLFGYIFLPEIKAGTEFAIQRVQSAAPDLLVLMPPTEIVIYVNTSKNGHSPSPNDDIHPLFRPPVLRRKEEDIEKFKQTLMNDKTKLLPESMAFLRAVIKNLLKPKTTLPLETDSKFSIEMKREYVKQMMKHAWSGYVKYAWGFNEVKPVSMKPHDGGVFGKAKIGATIVDAVDTLFIMGLKEEFDKGRQWIAESLMFDKVSESISVFETTIRFVGGLLSCYALTNDSMFLMKAEHIATKLLPAFTKSNGIPFGLLTPLTGAVSYNRGYVNKVFLAEIGSLHLEFVYLSHLTKNPIFKEKVFAIRHFLQKMVPKVENITPVLIANVNPSNRLNMFNKLSVGGGGDSFFEYLCKAWIQSGKTDEDAKTMYYDALRAIRQRLFRISRNGLLYLGNAKTNLNNKIFTYGMEMDHLTCFFGGLLALTAQDLADDLKANCMNAAVQLTSTCHESYARSPLNLGPETMIFSNNEEATAVTSGKRHFLLRPEVVESYFYLWRFTKDVKYRDWAWQVVLALEKHCKVAGGYSGLRNVYDINTQKDDVQQTYFLAETLKYLYLIFSDDLLPLDKWVFNTEAHPLPILGKNPSHPNMHFTTTAPIRITTDSNPGDNAFVDVIADINFS